MEADTPSSGPDPLHGPPIKTIPEFYGATSARIPLGGGDSATLVDRPDSTAPTVLILTAPGDEVASWAGVQSTLEQFGVASLVVPSDAGAAAVARAAEWVQAAAQRRSQPVALLAAGSATATAISLGNDSPLADRPLVLLSPPLAPRSGLTGLVARLPAWLRNRINTGRDSRLASWRGRVLVVRAKEERGLDAVAANALAAGGHDGRVLVVPGEGLSRAPLHPDQESWRDIADFIRGVVRPREEIVVPASPSDSISPPPADTLPLPQR